MKPPRRGANTILALILGILVYSRFARADIIVAASGPGTGSTFVAGISLGFTTSTAFQDVAISELFSNGGFPSATGTAYLTTSIGPGTTIADEIAQAGISVGCEFCVQEVVLFSGLDLAAGTYWLTFGDDGAQDNGLGLPLLSPAVAETGAGVSFLAFDSLSGGTGPYPPGGSLIADLTSNGLLPAFSVTTVPEPSMLGVMGAGIAILALVGLACGSGSKLPLMK
jgi:hypothetical protein